LIPVGIGDGSLLTLRNGDEGPATDGGRWWIGHNDGFVEGAEEPGIDATGESRCTDTDESRCTDESATRRTPKCDP
jgi:hypothetical protein